MRSARGRVVYKGYIRCLGMIYVTIDLCGLAKITDFCCNYFARSY